MRIGSKPNDGNLDAVNSIFSHGRCMQLSILIASNRTSLVACSRIAQACSWAAPHVEILVRDNSGDAQKRELLARFRQDHCNIIFADPCDMFENYLAVLRLAKGEFVFLLADDDFCFDHAVAATSALVEKYSHDPSVVGMTGTYIVESSQGSSALNYQDVDSDDVAARVAGYVSYGGPNVFHYAPIRRKIVERVYAFMRGLPFYFSYHDQIMSLLYLLHGKFVRLNRLLYAYDIGAWERPETAQKKDADFYRAAGLDPVMNLLHWYLCGFEGAVLARNGPELAGCMPMQRQAIADRWFLTMFMRFRGLARQSFDSPFADRAQQICAKLRTSTGPLEFTDMLEEICNVIALSSEPNAHRYYDFWHAQVMRGIHPE